MTNFSHNRVGQWHHFSVVVVTVLHISSLFHRSLAFFPLYYWSSSFDINALRAARFPRFAAPEFNATAPQAADRGRFIYHMRNVLDKKGGGILVSSNEEAVVPVVTLFAPACASPFNIPVVKVLRNTGLPHSLLYVTVPNSPENKDIENGNKNDYWFSRYRLELPVLHMGNLYWTVGRNLTPVVAANSLRLAADGTFVVGRDEPNAEAYFLPHRTETTTTKPKKAVRRAGSGNFQKDMLRAVAARKLGLCNVPDPTNGKDP